MVTKAPCSSSRCSLLAATLAGADDFVEIGLWGRQNIDFLRRFLPYKNWIPSHDTLGALMAALDPAAFRDCFSQWVARLRADFAGPDGCEIVAIDGKASRRSHDRKRPAPRLSTETINSRPPGSTAPTFRSSAGAQDFNVFIALDATGRH